MMPDMMLISVEMESNDSAVDSGKCSGELKTS